ncbi:hypothetical protein LMG28614_04342 [Paraburkholderia ultramafica]|uniref:Uncharacterized protein n=2 Tax=Paraburkholderia ultramafica TaxID=1544867 RepID=A0A6S7BF25_9BURK|nr:hypothetical protein LMG28614_04342 [Paraburkholderia ultramafica]
MPRDLSATAAETPRLLSAPCLNNRFANADRSSTAIAGRISSKSNQRSLLCDLVPGTLIHTRCFVNLQNMLTGDCATQAGSACALPRHQQAARHAVM